MNVAYRKLARKLHSGKYNESREFTKEEGNKTFQKKTNACKDLK